MHDYKLTYIRAIALFSIIVFHCLCYYSVNVAWPFHGMDSVVDSFIGSFFVSFALPFFVLISGTLAGTSQAGNAISVDILRKVKRLLLPYISWTIIQIPLFHEYTTCKTVFSGMFHLWFLLMLFWCYLVFFATRKQLYRFIDQKKFHAYILAFIALAVCRLLSRQTTNVLCLNQFITYLPFFLIGIILRRHDKLSIKPSNKAWYILVISIICFSICCIGKLVLETGGSIASLIMDISIVTSFISLYTVLPNKANNVFSWIENNSLGIYITHHIIIWLILTSSYAEGLNYLPLRGPLILFVTCVPTAFMVTRVISNVKILKTCLF